MTLASDMREAATGLLAGPFVVFLLVLIVATIAVVAYVERGPRG